MNIDSVASGMKPDGSVSSTFQPADRRDFSNVIEQAFDDVNDRIVKAEEMSEQMAAGKSVDIARVMTAVTKADLSFRMAMQVRNKALSAYEEIMRMQV